MMALESEIGARDRLARIVRQACESAARSGEIRSESVPPVLLEVPKREGQGDYASSVAMAVGSTEKRPPREIAAAILRRLEDPEGMLENAETAGPGFMNFTVKADWWRRRLPEIAAADRKFGRLSSVSKRRIQIEFVSANPTGPLHVGHGRWAAVGNAMANLLRSAGHEVHTEFYINDAGRQVKQLGRSVFARYQQLCGSSVPDPEDGYRGEYITSLAEGMLKQAGRKYEGRPEADCLPEFTRYSVDEMIRSIREDLEAFGIRFDSWFSEAGLFERGEVEQVLALLEEKGLRYERDGALWFKSTAYSDDKDRVIRKEDGEYTYLASDMAYHRDKLKRGFDQLINIWGADHHGYVLRMQAVIQALGYPKDSLAIKIGQLVTLVRSGQPVAMSKRSGEYITLRDVINEVGKDAALFFFLMRRLDSPLEFDLELAKQQTNENPVFYVQYAHARLSSVLRQAEEKGIRPRPLGEVDLGRLDRPEELALIRKLCRYPELIEDAAGAQEPHRITFFVQELAALLHNYYYHHRIITDDAELTQARLVLAGAVRIGIRNALNLLGVTAPDRM
jgi:arginyl-tRNA synthetase